MRPSARAAATGPSVCHSAAEAGAEEVYRSMIHTVCNDTREAARLSASCNRVRRPPLHQ